MDGKKRLVGYIDGFSLYYGLREEGWKRFYWLNLWALVDNLHAEGTELIKVKYFTSGVSATSHDPDKPKRQQAYLKALGSLPNLQIIYGRYELRPQECPYCRSAQTCSQCGLPQEKHIEKKTDVNIAVELVTDAVYRNFDVAILISGDSDLTPALMRARQFAKGSIFMVAYPPNRISNELGRAANYSFMIGRAKFNKSLFPDTVQTGAGQSVTRPQEWA
jgi:uncharacterized LabA/DUF88 family protein